MYVAFNLHTTYAFLPLDGSVSQEQVRVCFEYEQRANECPLVANIWALVMCESTAGECHVTLTSHHSDNQRHHPPVLDVLVGQGVVWIGGLLVPVGTLLAAPALSLHPEAADVRPVAFVVGRGARQLQEQVTGSGRFQRSSRVSALQLWSGTSDVSCCTKEEKRMLHLIYIQHMPKPNDAIIQHMPFLNIKNICLSSFGWQDVTTKP